MNTQDISYLNSTILNNIHGLRRQAALKISDDNRASRIIFDLAEMECNTGKDLLVNQAPYAALPHLQASMRLFKTLVEEK